MAGSAPWEWLDLLPALAPGWGDPAQPWGAPQHPRHCCTPSMQLPTASLHRDCLWRALPGPEYFQIADYSICTQGSLFLWLFHFTFLNSKRTLL